SGFLANPFNLPADFGWLSDPKTPAEDIADALFGGKFSMNNRLRWEHVSQTGRDETSAITNRTRFGYGTKALNGISAYVELENNTPFDRSDHSVPQASQGAGTKAVVADPEEVELNQAYVKYVSSKDADVSLNLIAGRQRIIIDDARFVGNVGWRQMEQTYDAFNISSDLGVKGLNVNYIYIWQVNRIFTEEATVAGATPFDSSSHVIHASYQFCKEFKLTGFGYLLDLENDGGNNNSSATYGVTGSGNIKLDDAWGLGYKLTYAHQSDFADSTLDYDADFFAIDVKLSVKDLGFGGVGFQLLGSDGGNAAFQFPLGTNHAYQGWADVFLTTPSSGVEDIYIYAGTKLPFGINAKIFYHDYSANKGGGDLGSEIDVVLAKKINKNWSVLAKLADYNGESSGNADRTKFWLETTFSF
ncbi:MAG TPA: hypothetical protein DER01_16345, partial [Phycisphaerales bacterium]|nr:hypothetical protein [Phycisphaerales bacterium]